MEEKFTSERDILLLGSSRKEPNRWGEGEVNDSLQKNRRRPGNIGSPVKQRRQSGMVWTKGRGNGESEGNAGGL